MLFLAICLRYIYAYYISLPYHYPEFLCTTAFLEVNLKKINKLKLLFLTISSCMWNCFSGMPVLFNSWLVWLGWLRRLQCSGKNQNIWSKKILGEKLYCWFFLPGLFCVLFPGSLFGYSMLIKSLMNLSFLNFKGALYRRKKLIA